MSGRGIMSLGLLVQHNHLSFSVKFVKTMHCALP